MKFGGIAATLGLGLTLALALSTDSDTAASKLQRDAAPLAQTSPGAAGGATDNAPVLQGIGLAATHKRIIYDSLADERAQTLSGDPQLAVGSTIPDSLRLDTMPIVVKDQVGLLRDFKFVKLQGDNILIVDPASRKIVDIVTKQEAGR